MNTLFVKPADGRTVLNPDNAMQPLASEGEPVPATMYWRHRIADGSVIDMPEPPSAAPPPRAQKSK